VILIVALSGRALAQAARRAGFGVAVADLFGDSDTRGAADALAVVAGDPARGLDAADLLAAAERLAPAGVRPPYALVYGSGMDGRVDLLAQLAAGRRLFGNSPATIARCGDPAEFFPLLDSLGIPHPETRLRPPANPAGWLEKRAGGSGGGHVRPAREGSAPEGVYYQRVARGRPVSVSFLADGRKAAVVGFAEQLTAPMAGAPYRFGGVAQPARLSAQARQAMTDWVAALAPALGLVGLNSLDAMADGDELKVLEINPRPGANLDVFDGAAGGHLFAHHVAACGGRLPVLAAHDAPARAMAILYADRALTAPPVEAWPDWIADRPMAGVVIPQGAPMCTVMADAPSMDGARALARNRLGLAARLLSGAPAAAVG
jgi:uncharacterized protein